MIPSSQIVFNGPLFPNAPSDVVAAMGKDGQFLNVVASDNMVWVRMGESPDSTILVPFLLNDAIWEYVNQLECSPAGVKSVHDNQLVQMYPNPASNIVSIKSEEVIRNVEVSSVDGRLIRSIQGHNKEQQISLENLPVGWYFIKVGLANGKQWTDKLLTR